MKESKKQKKRNGDAIGPNEKLEKALTYFANIRKFGEEGSIDRLVKFWEVSRKERKIKEFLEKKR